MQHELNLLSLQITSFMRMHREEFNQSEINTLVYIADEFAYMARHHKEAEAEGVI